MGTITVQLQGSFGTRSKTYNVSDADLDRLVAWAKPTFYVNTAGRGEPPTPPLTTPQAIQAWADAWIGGTKDAVRKFERDTARAAVPEPSDIPVT